VEIWKLFFIPLIIGIVSLVVEYWIVQPLRETGEISAFHLFRSSNSQWSEASKNAINSFKKQQSSNFGVFSNEKLRFESKSIMRGQAKIILAIYSNPHFLHHFSIH